MVPAMRTGASHTVQLFAALPAGQAPDWVHLVPAGTFSGVDGRGPYTLANAAAVIAASMAAGKLAIDENHATDLAAPEGRPSPARGWIVAIEARADGLWGKVDWTAPGAQLLAENAYRGISPVFVTDKTGRVVKLLRASLTNVPNLKLATLHQQNGDGMDLMAELRQALGLGEDADAAAVIAAVKALKDKGGADAAMQAQVKAIAKAAGLKEDAAPETVLNAVTALKAGPSSETVTALQAELTALTTKFTTLSDTVKREKAEAAVDEAIRAGKPGVKALRDHFITRHMADPAGVVKELAALPSLTGPSGASVTPPAKDKDGKVVLSAEQANAAKVLGIKPEDYAKTIAAEAANEEAA